MTVKLEPGTPVWLSTELYGRSRGIITGKRADGLIRVTILTQRQAHEYRQHNYQPPADDGTPYLWVEPHLLEPRKRGER